MATGKQIPGKSVARQPKPKKGVNKFELARDVYNSNLDKPRKEVLILFVTQCGMGKNYASTAYQMLKSQSES